MFVSQIQLKLTLSIYIIVIQSTQQLIVNNLIYEKNKGKDAKHDYMGHLITYLFMTL